MAIGADDDGATWLLDLEAAGLVQITGDHDAAHDLARFVAAELAMNPWSTSVDVTLCGTAQELIPLNPQRLSVDEALDIGKLTKAARRARDATEVTGLDALAGRLDGRGADSWLSSVIVTSVRDEHAGDVRRDTSGLLDELSRLSGRSPVALVTASSAALFDEGVVLSIDGWGRLSTPWGELTGNRLGSQDAAAVAALFAAVDEEGDEAMPVAVRADGEPPCSDVAGALRRHLTVERRGTGDLDSLLPRPDEEYVAKTATTPEDLAALARAVPPETADRIAASDPDLDADFADWSDPESERPKLRLLGPVEIQAGGSRPREVERRTAYYAELVAFLALRPDGATPEQMADAFSLQHNSLHTRIATLRKWLGTNPATGTWYLPESSLSTAGRARGVPVYQLEGVLCDADVFRRLRTRGEALGPHGVDDLQAALALVGGRPFDQLRPGGYGWLADNPVDHFLTAAIVDVAHIVATHALTEGRPELGVWAAERAITAAPSEDKPRLDFARGMAAMGHTAEAERYIDHEIHNRCDRDEPPPDTTLRTKRVLRMGTSEGKP